MVNYSRERGAFFFLIAIFIGHIAHAEDRISLNVSPINEPATSHQIPGKIIWHDLVTDNPGDTQQFYGELFGWQFKTYGSGNDRYILISHAGKPVGGIVPLTGQQATENDNQWVSYISVPDVEKAEAFVKANAGQVILSATRFEQQGKLAIFTDPEGALFGVLKSSSGDPVDARSKPGEWIWVDLMASNPQQQTKFYQGIADYVVQEDSRDPQVDDYYLLTGKVPRAGVVPLPTGKAVPKILPNWLPYISVARINEAVVKATTLGGRVILNPATQVSNGKLAIIADPSGAALGIFELTPKAN